MRKKTVKRHIDYGYGFPVIMRNVPMIQVDGKWTLDVNYKLLSRALLNELALLNARLTGSQVRFIRHHFRMTVQKFAAQFGVTHPSVLNWEKTGDAPSNMDQATEFKIRIFILEKLEKKDDELGQTLLRFVRNQNEFKKGQAVVEQDCASFAA